MYVSIDMLYAYSYDQIKYKMGNRCTHVLNNYLLICKFVLDK